MEEDSNIEVLQAFAKRTGRKIDFKVEQYPLPIYRKIPKFRRSVYIPMDANEHIFFVLYGDPYSEIGEQTAFCGVYFKIDIPQNVKLNFRKKNILDKLNLFVSKDIIKSENREFDSNVVITGQDSKITHNIYFDRELQNIIMATLKMNFLPIFSINETNVDFVPNLKGQSHFSILNPQTWILDDSTIEAWFEIMAKIRRIMDGKNLV